MRAVQIGVLGIGLALAGFGVYMAQNYVAQTRSALAVVQARNAAAPGAIATVNVMVTTRPMRYGEPIRAEDVRSVAWPANAVPPGVFNSMDDVVPDPDRPRVALRAMEPMEPLLAVKVSEPGQPAGITAILTPGMRAFTIRVDQNSGISGTLRPSDTVDIYWTGRGAQDGEVTRLLSSGVKIIALDENGDQDRTFNGIPRSVTVEAAPEMIASLAQGQSTGRLSLSLVGLDDTTATSQIQVDSRSLLGMETRAAAPVERCTVRTRRGSEVVMIEIPCTN
ncbi:MAG: Flp pilus assembly protein CpaB [Rhodobacter sp.]|uniref:Flp pilus assembly protein CpaB n=1 Tax=Pararhodobacter sp. TaxID=2127056 RepID=UPI001DD57FAF|nr:Flp pilus assembly protein CpaB [Pararhodobacter sp.]MCB1344578.1 Flp pilus assembly protein CpaB [Paracoccaceae bacterium]MCB1408234.1 Flp pilus assembly protein CpaB [Paracoccaceae bacterium]MCC0071913.1 Flp pilus assembly protein CpaB [Rhodobacter sp.]HPD91036.1 Flp pilus assembly protein CpaB [Pararhodobacter sp.]